jgi:hypothetical protein
MNRTTSQLSAPHSFDFLTMLRWSSSVSNGSRVLLAKRRLGDDSSLREVLLRENY